MAERDQILQEELASLPVVDSRIPVFNEETSVPPLKESFAHFIKASMAKEKWTTYVKERRGYLNDKIKESRELITSMKKTPDNEFWHQDDEETGETVVAKLNMKVSTSTRKLNSQNVKDAVLAIEDDELTDKIGKNTTNRSMFIDSMTDIVTEELDNARKVKTSIPEVTVLKRPSAKQRKAAEDSQINMELMKVSEDYKRYKSMLKSLTAINKGRVGQYDTVIDTCRPVVQQIFENKPKHTERIFSEQDDQTYFLRLKTSEASEKPKRLTCKDIRSAVKACLEEMIPDESDDFMDAFLEHREDFVAALVDETTTAVVPDEDEEGEGKKKPAKETKLVMHKSTVSRKRRRT